MTVLAQPIFVVGCPRSGTTLVQCMLSANSEVFSLPETHFFSHVLPLLGATPITILAPADVGDVRQLLDGGALGLPAAFWQTIEQRAPLTAMDVFLAIVAYFRPEGDAGRRLRVIEKTPRHVLFLQTIGEHFPDARFVNVVRDPIDVAASLLGVPFATSRSMLSLGQLWAESVLAARHYSQRAPERLYTIKYEDLVHEPAASLRTLCAFVDLAYEPAMLVEFGREAGRNVARHETWKRDVSRGALLDRTGTWRERMTSGQAWLAAQATWRLGRDYGYDTRVSASVGSLTRTIGRELCVRYREARRTAGMVGAARSAAAVLEALLPGSLRPC